MTQNTPWLWQLPDWPQFTWDEQDLTSLEKRFLTGSGRLVGASAHLDEKDRDDLGSIGSVKRPWKPLPSKGSCWIGTRCSLRCVANLV
ncbi:DUF4172 domain-containing protein [Nioella sp. MMSF_3534]|uniref:DUF4172 domain-containing protein n=1 Tax=Nioella sp. MMSF_3534 TaxID=3046720 RepID=UPI0035324987